MKSFLWSRPRSFVKLPRLGLVMCKDIGGVFASRRSKVDQHFMKMDH